jgi:DNA primase
MIKGKTLLEIIKENQEAILRMYVPDFQINKLILSPLRQEKNPSFIIYQQMDSFIFVDFGVGVKGDIINFICEYHKAPLKEALIKTYNDLQGNPISTYKRERINKERPYEQKEKCRIKCLVKPFTKDELKYWSSYYIDLEDLKKEKIYSLKAVFINEHRINIPDEFAFGYLYDNKYWKVYMPFEEKKCKWKSNLSNTYMEGKENLHMFKKDDGLVDFVIITKSKKDRMVISKTIDIYCVNVQSENMFCFNEENISFLKDNTRTQILSFDNDATGVANSITISNKFGFKYLNIPKDSGTKDFAEYAKVYGIDKLNSFINTKLNKINYELGKVKAPFSPIP